MSKTNIEILNKNRQFTQCCVYCGKTYKSKTNLDKHLILCQLLYDSKNRKSHIEDEIEVPSQRKLYIMLLELGNRFNKLEENVSEINKLVVRKKKKINIIEWLNHNLIPTFCFDKLVEKIVVDDSCVDMLFNNPFIDVMNNIFSNYLYQFSENYNENPMFAFIEKPNIFYIYENEEIKWLELSKEKLISFLMKIQMKIQRTFYLWKKKNSEKIMNDDYLSIKCDKTTINIVSVNFKEDISFNKIRNLIYTRMKTDIKELIEYEFEFN